MPEIEIKIIIEDTNLEELKTGFLKAVERPPQYSGLTDIQFFKKWLQDNIISAYKTGKIMIAQETTQPVIIEDIVEVV